MDTKEVKHIAKLARLKFEGEELENITKDMSGILAWIDILQNADTSAVKNIKTNIEPLPMREDVVKIAGISEDLIKNAPEPYEHFFTVPKVVE